MTKEEQLKRKNILLEAKKRRNEAIRLKFSELVDKNYRLDYAVELLVYDYGLAPSTIWAIVKRYGYYANV